MNLLFLFYVKLEYYAKLSHYYYLLKIPLRIIAICINKIFSFIFCRISKSVETQPKKATMTKKLKNKIWTFTPELSAFIGKKVATRAQAFKIVFAYVKEHKLQDPNDKGFILPDKKMSKIFGKKRMRILSRHSTRPYCPYAKVVLLPTHMCRILTNFRNVMYCFKKYSMSICKKFPKYSSGPYYVILC